MENEALILTPSAHAAIEAAAAAGYPEEICGLLVAEAGHVVAAEVLPNVWPVAAERRRRFLLDPLAHLKLERSLDGSDRAVVGSFHSHPDHPAEPSAYDLEASWPGYIYVIVPVEQGRPGPPRAWRVDSNSQTFAEVAIVIGTPNPLG